MAGIILLIIRHSNRLRNQNESEALLIHIEILVQLILRNRHPTDLVSLHEIQCNYDQHPVFTS